MKNSFKTQIMNYFYGFCRYKILTLMFPTYDYVSPILINITKCCPIFFEPLVSQTAHIKILKNATLKNAIFNLNGNLCARADASGNLHRRPLNPLLTQYLILIVID